MKIYMLFDGQLLLFRIFNRCIYSVNCILVFIYIHTLWCDTHILQHNQWQIYENTIKLLTLCSFDIIGRTKVGEKKALISKFVVLSINTMHQHHQNSTSNRFNQMHNIFSSEQTTIFVWHFSFSFLGNSILRRNFSRQIDNERN